MKELSRDEQLGKWRRRYEQRNPDGKARILDELCEQYNYHRKHAIRLMNAPAEPPSPRLARAGPEAKYQSLGPIVEAIW